MAPLLEVRDLTLRRDDGSGSAILNVGCELNRAHTQNLNLEVKDGEVLIIQGESGCGYVLRALQADVRKTTLLKCIAELNVYQKGEVLLRGEYVTWRLSPTACIHYSH